MIINYFYLCSVFVLGGFSERILVKAAAASSSAQETLEVSRRSTSGSAKCLPSPDESLPIPLEI